ncbi:hypothetical protein ACFW3D_27310 [Streptomyces sp. NPDC058864]
MITTTLNQPWALDPFHDDYDRRAASTGALSGISTGFIDLNTLTNGVQPGQLIVVAGPPPCASPP